MKTSKESEIDSLLADALDDLYDKSLVRAAIDKINDVKRKYSCIPINDLCDRSNRYLNKSLALKDKSHKAKAGWIEKARNELRFKLDTMIRMFEENE